MLAISARMVPDMAFACNASPSRCTVTSLFNACFKVPNGPFTETSLAASVTSTPAGTTIGFLATLDMITPLRDDAQNFAADSIGACLVVSHQPFGGRHDGDTQAVHHLGYIP